MPEPVNHSLVTALRCVPEFRPLDDRALLALVGASVNLFWPKGSTIFEKGSASEALYIVLDGKVRIFDRGDDGSEHEVSRLGSGQSFGELSLLLFTTHSKSAEALEDTELMVIPKESFQDLLTRNAELAALFRQRLEERLPPLADARRKD